MAIRTIDGVAGVESVREPRAVQTAAIWARRVATRPESSAPNAAAEPTRPKSEQQQAQPNPAEQQARDMIQASNSMRFKVDQESGKTVAELVDPDGQVLRQMPTEEALDLAKAIGKYQGMFVNLKV
jgi:flagellar protein FlaG